MGIEVQVTVAGKQFCSLQAAQAAEFGRRQGSAHCASVHEPIAPQHAAHAAESPTLSTTQSFAQSTGVGFSAQPIRQLWIVLCAARRGQA